MSNEKGVGWVLNRICPTPSFWLEFLKRYMGMDGAMLSVSPSSQSIFSVIDCFSKHELLGEGENFSLMAEIHFSIRIKMRG